jgi:Endoribonuclease L-PSP
MTQTALLRPEGLVNSPAFSHVAVVPPGATAVYVGGQNAVDGDGKLVGGDDVAAQTEQVMRNLHVALAAAGATFSDVRRSGRRGEHIHQRFERGIGTKPKQDRLLADSAYGNNGENTHRARLRS